MMIARDSVFEIKPKYRPNPVLIRIRKTQQEVTARPCANGFALANGDFIHHTAAKIVRLLDES